MMLLSDSRCAVNLSAKPGSRSYGEEKDSGLGMLMDTDSKQSFATSAGFERMRCGD